MNTVKHCKPPSKNKQESTVLDFIKKKTVPNLFRDNREESYNVSDKMSNLIHVVMKTNELEEIICRKQIQQNEDRVHMLIERTRHVTSTIDEDLKFINKHIDVWKDADRSEKTTLTPSINHLLQKEFVADMENLAESCNKINEMLKNSKLIQSNDLLILRRDIKYFVMDPAKLKVVELKAELSSRGLDSKGVKAVLVERLKQALEEESEALNTAEDDNSVEEEPDDEAPEDAAGVEIGEEEEEEGDNEERKESEVENVEESLNPEPVEDEEPVNDQEPEFEPEPEPELEDEPMDVQIKQEPKEEPEEPKVSKDSGVQMSVEPKQEPIKEEKIDYEIDNFENFKKKHYEAEVKQEPQEHEVKEEKKSTEEKSNSYSNDRKRKHSSSPSFENQDRQKFTRVWKDHEPEIDDNIVQLSWYDSDLNLIIDQNNFLVASPMSDQGFGFIWAGVRANYGFISGQTCFEVKLIENNDVSHLEDEPSPHVLRIGWSILSSGMLLGEEPFSYGYGGTGKSSTNCNFSNYGKPFVVGDVVTAYLDYGADQIVMSFSVNGEWQKEAYTLPHSTFDGQALFPHVLTKNIKFELNFGEKEPWFQPLPGYTWASQVAPEQRVAGPKRPEKRGDCEMLMMCGLPGCGKTVWANEWASKYPEKFYNILGSNNLIDKMKIQGLPRKRNYHGRWDLLIEKCMKCLNKLLEMSHKRRRNYILDQTNVYPSAQKRKMRNFGGFVRRAIVIVPNDEEFQRRVAKREAEEGKDVPDSAVMEMKANFKLPEKGEYFDEVIYTELSEEEARPLVEKYNKEGKDAGYGQQNTFSGSAGRGNKRFRSNERPQWGGGGNFRGHNRGMDRHGMDRNRGGWHNRGDRGGLQGWRDRKPPGSYRRDDHDRDHGWRGGMGGGRDNYARDNYRGRDNYGGGRDNYGGGRDNYGGGRDNYGGRDDRPRGNFDRNRRDGQSNRNSRDNKPARGGNQGQSGGSGKQANWGNTEYNQQWGQSQNYDQSWGQQNYQQGWKGPEQQQQQPQQPYNAYGNQQQYNQYGGFPQYGAQGWNQGGNQNYAYGQQGMNTYGYSYGAAPPAQGK